MYRRPNRTEYFSPSFLSSSSSNPNFSNPIPPPPSSPMSDDDHDATPPSNKNSPSPSPSPPPPCTSNLQLTLPPPPQQPAPTRRQAVFPAREDCWSEAATHTLIEAWGSHYLELKRGNLRQKHWQEVADAVNALHGHTKKQYRTDIQCKNRIDTLKKKYKIEKARVSQSNGRYVSTWPHFNSLDDLIGPNFKLSPSPVTVTVTPRQNTPPMLPPPPSAVPVGPRSKRPAAAAIDHTVSRRNFSAMAAAAAASASQESDGDEESETSSPGTMFTGYSRLADAIGRFAEIYERVEHAKQKQMVELEIQRMQFAKDLELQRMRLIMESQVNFEKLKRAKTSSQAGMSTRTVCNLKKSFGGDTHISNSVADSIKICYSEDERGSC